mmetsp:Transcript_46087/g.84464  ORF Transcript_46087/g.84464 Transcript_46087/m.84464 type:complete len:150 (+) Transcript_46087:115-564(+)
MAMLPRKPPGVVSFNVGGQRFDVLERTIRAKGDTLLCTMLDDPELKNSDNEEIFVEGDATLFRFILSWYRYGRILLPTSISEEEMRRECAFFQLPDEVQISCDTPYHTAEMLDAMRGIRRAVSEIEDNLASVTSFYNGYPGFKVHKVSG